MVMMIIVLPSEVDIMQRLCSQITARLWSLLMNLGCATPQRTATGCQDADIFLTGGHEGIQTWSMETYKC
jgi:hypothetical protein